MLIYVSTLIIVFFFIVFLGLLFWSITIYNSLVKQRILVNEGWSSIDVQLLRRMNLIPNLVSAVKGYMKHEAEGLEDIVPLNKDIFLFYIDLSWFLPLECKYDRKKHKGGPS